MAEKSVQEQLREIYTDYNQELAHAVAEATEEVAKETAEELKASSARKSGKYARGWKAKAEGGTVAKGAKAVVHNTTAPQLTHLLEKGHMVANQYGTYGRTNGDGVIADAQAKAEVAFIRKIKGVLE